MGGVEFLKLAGENPREAAAKLNVLELPNKSVALLGIIGNLNFQVGNYEEAQRAYTEALAQNPDQQRIQRNAALLYMQQNKPAEAIPHLAKAIALGDGMAQNYGRLGLLYLNTDQIPQAEVAYRHAYMMDPRTKDWGVGLLQVLRQQDKHRDAFALLQILTTEFPDQTNFWLILADTASLLERYTEAAAALEAVRMLGEENARYLFMLADIYIAGESPIAAAETFVAGMAQDEDGERMELVFERAEMMLFQGNTDEALTILGGMRKHYDLSKAQELRTLVIESKIAKARGNDEESLRILRQIVERDPNQGGALMQLADHAHQSEDIPKAVVYLEQAQRLPEYRYNAHIQHARMMAELGRFEEAVEQAEASQTTKEDSRVRSWIEQLRERIKG